MTRRAAPTVRASSLRRSLAVCRPHLAGNGALAAAGLGAMLAEVALRLLEPWPVRVVVDAVVPSAVDGATTDPHVVRTVAVAAVVTLTVVAARALASFSATLIFAVVGSRVTTRLRGRVYEHLLGLSSRFHDRARPGDLVVRLTGDVQRLQEVAVSAALPLVGNAVLFVGMTAVIVVLDPVLAVAVLAVAPLFLFTGTRSGSRITAASRDQRRTEGAIASVAAESLGAMKVVQAYGLAPILAGRFSASNVSSLRDGVRARRLAAGLERRTDVIVGVATAVVLFVGAVRVLHGALTPGELVVVLSYQKTAFRPMRDIAKQAGRIARAAASGERIADLLDVTPEIRDRAGVRDLRRARGDIRFTGVTLGYDPGRPVLHVADLHIRPGERVAVVGASGAGKSTLTNAVLRLIDPVEGTVFVDGHDTRDLTVESLRRNVAVVLQDSILFAASVAENVRLGRPDASDAEVRAAVRAANAAGFVARLPDGLDTIVGERGATLSGGERQRIAIARAILRDAPIVVLDEPTTGLDRASAEEVMVALGRLGEGRTTLVVAHDPLLTAGCHRVLHVTGGTVVEVAPSRVAG